MINYPKQLDVIFNKLLNNSINPFIVGGFVRDFLLQKESKDIDIELYGIQSFSKLEEILKEFGSVNSFGRSFGVCKLKLGDLDLDFSFARKDSKVSQGHKGFEVEFDTKLDFKTATSRRDFTINAIAFDVQSKKILDPFNGINDLKKRVLKAVDTDKFREDPLRVLRAVQFSSRFHLTIDKKLFKVCKNMVANRCLNELPKERIFLEIQKLLLKSSLPSTGIELLKNIGTFIFFIEFKELDSTHYNSTLKALDKMSSLKTKDEAKNTLLMFSVLCHKLSSSSSKKLLTKLTTNSSLIAKILNILEHKNSLNFNDFIDYDIYTLATKVNIEEFSIFSHAITDSQTTSKNISKLKIRAQELGVLNAKAVALLQGRDLLILGMQPSKEFSKILAKAYIAQISGIFHTKDDALIWLKKLL